MSSIGIELQEVLDRLVEAWRPPEIRDLAATLLRLADSLEQAWPGSNVKSVFGWHSELASIERNALNLAKKARLLSQERERRRENINADLLGEPAWDMLLDLFMQYAAGTKVSITSLCIASRGPASTALRYITLLEEIGYVARSPSNADKRVTFVSLTNAGVLAVGRHLERV